MNPEKFVEARLHQVVADAGKPGISTTKIDALVSADLRVAIQQGMTEPPDLIQFVRGTRRNLEKRMRTQRNELMLHIQACLRDETILGPNDPTLDTEAVVAKGQRKVWRWVTIEDGDSALELQRQNVEATEQAYHASAAAWATIKTEMRRRGARFVGDLWQ